MNRPSPSVITLLILLGVGILGGAVVAVQSIQGPPPDFSVPTTDNETFTLHEHRGHVVVLEFFATSCAPCKTVERNVKAALPSWNGTGAEILSVAIWGENLTELKDYHAKDNLSWPLAPNTDRLTEKYNVYAIPQMVILDASGRVVFVERGYGITQDKIESQVAAAVRGDLHPFGIVQYGLIGLAMVSGAAAFFSPCAIGMLPSYVAHTVRTRTHPGASGLRVGTIAALGVLLVFFGIGGIALASGPALVRYVPYLEPLVGFLLIVLGVLLLARPFSLLVQRWTAPVTEWAMQVNESGPSGRSFFAYGIAYGAAAAGCTLPVLLTVLLTAAAYGALVGTAIVTAYALTGAFFMVLLTVLSATFGNALGPWLVRRSRWIEAVAAFLFVLGGAYLLWTSLRAGTFSA